MMKSVSLIRSIDDLGRVVIPNELRKLLQLDTGDKVEMYAVASGDRPSIAMRKYSTLNEVAGLAKMYANTIFDVTNESIVICDTTYVIASCPNLPVRSGDKITESLSEFIKSNRLPKHRDECSEVFTMTCTANSQSKISAIYPIYCNTCPTGAIIVLGERKVDPITDGAIKVAVGAIKSQIYV